MRESSRAWCLPRDMREKLPLPLALNTAGLHLKAYQTSFSNLEGKVDCDNFQASKSF